MPVFITFYKHKIGSQIPFALEMSTSRIGNVPFFVFHRKQNISVYKVEDELNFLQEKTQKG